MKRLVLWLTVIFMLIATSIVANAEEAVPEIPPPSDKPVAGYKKGFFIQNSDGSFVFKITGRFQPRVEYNKTADTESDWTFLIRRARIDFGGTIAEKGSFYITLQHSTKSAKFQTVNVANVTASYEFMPEFTLTAGMVGMPLSILGTRSSLGYFLLEPPIVLTQTDGLEEDGTSPITTIRNSFGNPDGLGLEATGSIGKFNYDFSIVNGAAATDTTAKTGGEESNYDLNPNKKVSSGIRLSYNILDSAEGSMEGDFQYSEKPKWTVSIGGNYQGKRQDPYSAAFIKYILTGSFGTSFKWRGFAVNAEAFGRKTKLEPPYPAGLVYSDIMDDFGYYIDAGYFIVPNKFEVAGLGAQIFREGPNNNSYQLGGGVNWYIAGNNLKLQLAYTMTSYYSDITNTQIKRDSKLGLMLSASF